MRVDCTAVHFDYGVCGGVMIMTAMLAMDTVAVAALVRVNLLWNERLVGHRSGPVSSL